MTLQQLRYIVALDQHRHFARAAEDCQVTQPGLTIQLKNLEEEIGIKIFDRTKVPMKPTPAGIEIIERAKKLLREADAIRDYVVHKKNDLTGNITLGVIGTLSPYIIPVFIRNIRHELPDVNFTIIEGSTGHLMHYLETGAIDIALMATPTAHPGFKEYVVFEEPFVACLHNQHPMAMMEYFELQPEDKPNLLLLKNEYCFNAQLLDICGLKEPGFASGNVNYEINTIETLKKLVKAGIGFALLPKLSVENDTECLYKPFKEGGPAREISLVVTDTFNRKLLLEKINKLLWDCLPPNLKENRQYKKIRWNDSPYFIKEFSKHI
jgi:LysR family hydrogen peroxide-inducible transcriptional activator